MNPCPCGYFQLDTRPCTCAPATVTKYQKRVSGRLLDKIDIHIEVPHVDHEKLSADRVGESSEAIRARVQATRGIQSKRFSNNGSTDIVCMQICASGDGALLQIAGGGQALVGAYHRILKLVRTIAELMGSEEIQLVATCVYQRMHSGTIRVLLARCILPGTCCNHLSSRIDHAQDESERYTSNRS